MVAELFSACTAGAVLTAWALHLGLGPFRIAVLTALPQLAQLVQVPAAGLTSSLGYRRVALACVGASRVAFLFLAVEPWLSPSHSSQQILLLSVAAASAVLGVMGNNAWVAWMADLVPPQVRGRYFGQRTALTALAGMLSSFFVGAALDGAGARGLATGALSGLALLAALTGLLSVRLMAQQHASRAQGRCRLDLLAIVRPYGDPRLRPLLGYQVLWNAASGLASAFYAVHMLQNLQLGFLLLALYNGGINAVRVLSAPFWGRALDRVGARPVLVACTAGLAALPLLWLLPPALRFPMLCIDFLVYGFLYAGHGLAAFSLPLIVSPEEGRPYYLAGLSMAGGLAFAAASAAGGALLRVLPTHLVLGGATFHQFQVLFVLSACGRAMAMWMARRLREPRAQPTDALLQLLRSSATRLTAGRLAPQLIRR
jgi:MFS family permease